jgi:Holliday junction resolvase RusA-like endonuclease
MLKEYTKNLAKEITAKMSEIQIKENVENGTFKVVASDETVDRSGEQIKVSSRDLKNYMKNPIILF